MVRFPISIFSRCLVGVFAGMLFVASTDRAYSVQSSPARKHETTRAERVSIVGESPFLQKRIDSARQRLASGKREEALHAYRTLLDEVGDSLIPARLPKERIYSTTRSVAGRHLIHQALASLDKKTLAEYQDSVDVFATRALQQGRKTRSGTILRKLVGKAYAHPAAAKAIRILGELAFERGRFGAAKQWWSLLGPTQQYRELHHPDPRMDLGEIRALWTLAAIFEGNHYRARRSLRLLEKLAPKATLHFGGKDVVAVRALRDWLKRDLKELGERGSWLSVGGDLAHAHRLSSFPSSLVWTKGETWRVKLPDRRWKPNDPEKPPAKRCNFPEHPRCYPVLSDGLVLVSTETAIYGYDARTGTKHFAFRVPRKALGFSTKADANGPASRFVPAVADGRVFCVLGHRSFSAGQDTNTTRPVSLLVCLRSGTGTTAGQLLWKQLEKGGPKATTLFSSNPLVFDGHVYVIREELAGFRWESSLVCYSATRGEKLWETPLLRSLQWEEAEESIVRQPSLTLAGNVIVYCSNNGAVVGLDPFRGKPLWAVGYSPREEQSLPLSAIGPGLSTGAISSVRELCPCLFADSRLFVAPSDADRIYCLDPLTGRTLWERDRINVVHLLGCHDGRLVFTTDRSMRSVDCDSGSDKGGWLPPTTGVIRTTGRGFLGGDAVLWPTGDTNCPIKLLDSRTGRPILGKISGGTALRKLRAGNFGFADGVLVVATPTEIVGYVQRKP